MNLMKRVLRTINGFLYAHSLLIKIRRDIKITVGINLNFMLHSRALNFLLGHFMLEFLFNYGVTSTLPYLLQWCFTTSYVPLLCAGIEEKF